MPHSENDAQQSGELVQQLGAGDVLPGEVNPDQVLLDQAVAELNRIYVEKGLDMVLSLGRAVLDTFFDGQIAAFRARGEGHATFRELANREDLRVSFTTLWRAVSVLDQFSLFPEAVARALPASHHAALLPLREDKKKVELARHAVARAWTRAELEQAVRKAKGPSKAGRPALPRFVKTLHQWRHALEQGEEAFGDLEAVAALGEGEAAGLLETVTRMKVKCEALEAALRGRG